MITAQLCEYSQKLQTHPAKVQLSAAELSDIATDPNRWVQDTIAEYITGIPKATLRRRRHEGRGPRYVKTGVSCRYKVQWLHEYMTQNVVETRDSRRAGASA